MTEPPKMVPVNGPRWGWVAIIAVALASFYAQHFIDKCGLGK